MADDEKSHNWWQTLPGLLTAAAGIITAIAGLVAILNQAGFLQPRATPPPSASTTTQTEKPDRTPSPPASTAAVSAIPLRSQSLSWGPDQGKDPGACLDGCATFLPWAEFRSEIEKLVLPMTSHLPPNTSTQLAALAGQKARVIQVTDQTGTVVGNVWVGVNPAADWRFDGLLRVGSAGSPPQVWASFERLSNGSYRRH
jgi:hypothetical protein